MAVYFLDTSAPVKRYVAETGTAWVTSLMVPVVGKLLYLARMSGVEVVSALVRRAAGGALSPAHVAAALRQFRADFKTRFQLIGITAALVKQAMELAEAHAVRSYDAVQRAAALRVQERCLVIGQQVTVVSADAELNTAAGAEGLLVEDPNRHP